MERVRPVTITGSGGEEYTLEFNRAVVRKAESEGFTFGRLKSLETEISVSLIEDLFYYSFLMHHRTIKKSETNAILDEMGGIPQKMLSRLVESYASTYNTLIRSDGEEDPEKNPKWTVTL